VKEELIFEPGEITSVSIICQKCHVEHLIPKPFPPDAEKACWQCRAPLNVEVARPLMQALLEFDNPKGVTVRLRMEKSKPGRDSHSN